MKATELQTPKMVFKEVIFLFATGLSVFLAFPSYALAPESICARADIDWCVDFDELTNCTTGQEAQCQTDNDITLSVNNSNDFKITTCPITPVVGVGCAYGSGTRGGTGPGYSTRSVNNRTAVSLRYYVRFGDGWMQNNANNGNHGPGLLFADGSNCTGIIAPDFTWKNFRVQVETNNPSTCGGNGPDSYNLALTDGTWTPENGIWYLVEMRAFLNTTASSSAYNSGDGTIAVYVNGTLILEYTNLNIRGNSTTSKFSSAYLARSYYTHGVPAWQPNIYFDQFVLSGDGTVIGAASEAGSAGTAISESPYVSFVAYDACQEQKIGQDCSVNGAAATKYVASEDWGDGKTYQSTIAHNTYTNSCDANPGKALKAETTAANHSAGVQHYIYGDATEVGQYATHGWIYLPSTNSYTSVVPLVGLRRYCAGVATGCYAAIANIGGYWGITLKKDGTVGTSHTSALGVTTNTWHEYELLITNANKCSLYIDNTWVIDTVTCNQDVDLWLFDAVSAGDRSAINGITYASPATTFTIYNDDFDIGTASFVGCRGWGSDCQSGLASPNSHNLGIKKRWAKKSG